MQQLANNALAKTKGRKQEVPEVAEVVNLANQLKAESELGKALVMSRGNTLLVQNFAPGTGQLDAVRLTALNAETGEKLGSVVIS